MIMPGLQRRHADENGLIMHCHLRTTRTRLQSPSVFLVGVVRSLNAAEFHFYSDARRTR